MPCRANRSARCGFTLLEVLLVLALIVVVSAIVAPSFRGPLETWRVRQAAGQIQTEWARARSTAIQHGEVVVFRYQTTTGRYFSRAWQLGMPLPVAASETTLNESPNNDSKVPRDSRADQRVYSAFRKDESKSQGEPIAKLLPDGMVFVEPDPLLQPQADGWSPPIAFFPDGTTSSARVVVVNDDNRAAEVTLRGLTGTVRVSEVSNLETFLPLR